MRQGRTPWDFMSELLRTAVAIAMFSGWMLGFVYAKGFWSTLFCWMPFYAWYLTIEHFAYLF